jgi:hypothetical protein
LPEGFAPADDQKGVIQEGFGVLDRSGGAVVLSGRHTRHLAAESNNTLKSRSMNFDWKWSGVFRSWSPWRLNKERIRPTIGLLATGITGMGTLLIKGRDRPPTPPSVTAFTSILPSLQPVR